MTDDDGDAARGEMIFEERLKRFDITGITDDDMHDRRVHESYREIAEEFISRLNAELEGAEK